MDDEPAKSVVEDTHVLPVAVLLAVMAPAETVDRGEFDGKEDRENDADEVPVTEGKGVGDTLIEGERYEDVDGLKVELRVEKDEAVLVYITVAEENTVVTGDKVI